MKYDSNINFYIYKLVTTKYDKPYVIADYVAQEKPCSSIYPILLPGMTVAQAEGCLYYHTVYSVLLSETLLDRI